MFNPKGLKVNVPPGVVIVGVATFVSLVQKRFEPKLKLGLSSGFISIVVEDVS